MAMCGTCCNDGLRILPVRCVSCLSTQQCNIWSSVSMATEVFCSKRPWELTVIGKCGNTSADLSLYTRNWLERLAEAAWAFSKKAFSHVCDAVVLLKSMAPELRGEYSEVEKLVCYCFLSHLLRPRKLSGVPAPFAGRKFGCAARYLNSLWICWQSAMSTTPGRTWFAWRRRSDGGIYFEQRNTCVPLSKEAWTVNNDLFYFFRFHTIIFLITVSIFNYFFRRLNRILSVIAVLCLYMCREKHPITQHSIDRLLKLCSLSSMKLANREVWL